MGMKIGLMSLGDIVDDPISGRPFSAYERYRMMIEAAEAGDNLGLHGIYIGEHHGIDRAGAAGRDAFKHQTLFIKQPIKHAPGERAMGSAALKRQIDDFLSSDIFLGSVRRSAGAGCAEILIDQFHCCCGGITCQRPFVDNSVLLHCKDRSIIFFDGRVLQNRTT